MGSKGSQTIPTSQTQTYTPAPAAYNAILSAMQQGQNVAQTPFQTPVAPVAGFSPQQQQAFALTGAAQGMAQPYINQAAYDFSPQGAQAYANPYVNNVTAQLQNIFGQQMSQATGQAVAQAGGTGADRIALAQGQLANQQGLAAGQTYANLYNQAAQQAQTAGFGTANLGTTAQNAALQGAQALLGTGGLQQQQLQAQLNAPYQNILQQIAWPYQNAQFNASITGALAPGLGGTTSGVSQTTYPGANPLAQYAGLGLAAYGAYQGSQNKGSGTSGNSYMSNPVGMGGYGGAQVGYDANGNYFNYSGSARGGRINPYADGGATPDNSGVTISQTTPQGTDPYLRMTEEQQLMRAGADAPQGQMAGQLPSGVSGTPINMTPSSIVPQDQVQQIQPKIPTLNMQQPQQSGSGSKGSGLSDLASIAKTAATIAAIKRGGRVNPYADGGDVPDDPYAQGIELLKQQMGTTGPQQTDPALTAALQARAAQMRQDMAPPSNQPIDLTKNAPLDADALGLGKPVSWSNAALAADRASPPPGGGGLGAIAQQFGPAGSATAPMPRNVMALQAPGTGGATVPAPAPPTTQPPAPMPGGPPPMPQMPAQPPLDRTMPSTRGLTASPYMNPYLMMGLNILAASGQRDARGLPLSPMTAIGGGALAGLKAQESIEDSAKKLDLEAQRQLNEYTRMKPNEQYEAQLKARQEWFNEHKPQQMFGPYGMPTGSQRWDEKTQSFVSDSATATPIPEGAYDYTTGAPSVKTGMEVPEPPSTVLGRSAQTFKTEAEQWLETGKAPQAIGGAKAGPMNLAYTNAIKNYAGAIAQQRGLTIDQVVDMQRSAPGMLKFILSADGRSTVSLGTAMRHLDTLREYAKAWAAHDTQAINQIQAVLSRQFGSEVGTDLETAAHIVGPEIIKAIGIAGGGTADERDKTSGQFSTARGPDQVNGAIGVTERLLGGQLVGKQLQAAAAGVNTEKFKSLIGDRQYQQLQDLDHKKGGAGTTAPPPPAPPPGAPSNAKLAPDGKYYVPDPARPGKYLEVRP